MNKTFYAIELTYRFNEDFGGEERMTLRRAFSTKEKAEEHKDKELENYLQRYNTSKTFTTINPTTVKTRILDFEVEE